MKNYKNKSWLETQYEKKTTYQIAEMEGVDPETIRKWMIKFDLKRRDANIINYSMMTEELSDFMTGSMLGDGSISWGHEGVSAYYAISSSRQEYLLYVNSKLNKLNLKLRGHIDLIHRGKYRYWQLCTKYYRGALPEFRQIWYPSGKKFLPKNIELTKESLLTFYLEDGSLTTSHGHTQLCLAVNGFMLDEATIIKSKICEIIGSNKVFVHCYKQGPTVWIFDRSVIKDFFDFIGPCPKELESVFGYKWRTIK